MYIVAVYPCHLIWILLTCRNILCFCKSHLILKANTWQLDSLPITWPGYQVHYPFHCHISLSKLNIKMWKHELCLVTMCTLESTYQGLSFEWSHLQILLDSSGFRRFRGLVKFTFGSERSKEANTAMAGWWATCMTTNDFPLCFTVRLLLVKCAFCFHAKGRLGLFEYLLQFRAQ